MKGIIRGVIGRKFWLVGLLVILSLLLAPLPAAAQSHGDVWTPMDSGTTVELRSVWGSSGNDVFAVSYYGTVLHYDGSNWSRIFVVGPFQNNLHGVWGSSGSDVFVVGSAGTILHYGTINNPPVANDDAYTTR